MIIMSNIVPSLSFAADDYGKMSEEVVLKVKKLLNIPDDYDEFTSNVSSYDGNTFFYLNWVDSKGKLDNISVNVDINGKLIYYNKYPSIYVEPTSKLAKYTKEQAEKIAMDFIKKVDPDISKEIKLIDREFVDNIMDTNYNFNYGRYVNNIFYKQNSVYITIDKYTGDVTNYSANWERDITFPSPNKVISLENGQEAFKREIGIHPIYKTQYYYRPMADLNLSSKYYLAYSIITGNQAIDAFTGEKTNVDYYGPYYEGSPKAMANERGDESSGLTPTEQESLDKIKGLLDEEKAVKKAMEYLNLDSSYKLNSKNLYTNYKNPSEYNWQFSFSKEKSKNQIFYIDISIDAKTGELLSFYKSIDYTPDAKAKISYEEALEIGKAYIEKIQPEKINEIELIPEYSSNTRENQTTYGFGFIRKTDGVYVENDRIYVAVDGVSGELYSYNLDWYKGELPPKEGLIPIDKAYDILWKEIGLELFYIKVIDWNKPVEEQSEIKLVYHLNTDKPAIISGTTGELLDYSGQPYKDRKAIEYVDIENSYAKDMINTLGQYGIGFEEKEFRPKDKMIQKDFLYLLWKAINPWRNEIPTEDTVYNELIKQNIIKEEEKSPDKTLTKEEGVKYLLRVMKLDKVAEIEEIYKDIFKDSKDISKGLKGYINLAYGLKIISGDGSGNIKPKYQLKREDAASMIYKYMFNE